MIVKRKSGLFFKINLMTVPCDKKKKAAFWAALRLGLVPDQLFLNLFFSFPDFEEIDSGR